MPEDPTKTLGTHLDKRQMKLMTHTMNNITYINVLRTSKLSFTCSIDIF
jgi:hypothetical protein